MLAIRLQRTGRQGHAQFRVVVQDSRQTPTSGRLVAHIGSYNPHTKVATIDKEKVGFYLEHGAQPSDRMARLLKNQGVKLPKWVKLEADKKRDIRNSEKLRKNRPADAKPAEKEPSKSPETPTAEEKPAKTPAVEPAKETQAEASTPEVLEEKSTEPANEKTSNDKTD